MIGTKARKQNDGVSIARRAVAIIFEVHANKFEQCAYGLDSEHAEVGPRKTCTGSHGMIQTMRSAMLPVLASR